jgi:thiamine-phosphate pyrophosphorylase
MPASCILYYITDRKAFPGDDHARRLQLLDKIAEAAAAGINYIQLREKDLPSRDLESLAREAIEIIRNQNKLRAEDEQSGTTLLINSRTDLALATNATGVHLPSNGLSPKEVRQIWTCGAPASEISPTPPQISISCHSPQEVVQAASNQATLALFAPIFEKKETPESVPAGLDALREACSAKIPVLALGGVTPQNAASCLQAGAAGIAAIRLFQENNIAEIVRMLCGR